MIDAPATRVAPWQAGPRQLWSLLDMIQFLSSGFAESLRCLHFAAKRVADLEGAQVESRHAATFLAHCLANLKASLGTLELSPPLDAARQRLEASVEYDDFSDKASRERILILLDEYETGVLIELRSYLFLAIAPARRNLFEQPEPAFGRAVYDRFGDAKEDVAAACRCVALDEWTAAVFHLMRVVEHGLRHLAGC